VELCLLVIRLRQLLKIKVVLLKIRVKIQWLKCFKLLLRQYKVKTVKQLFKYVRCYYKWLNKVLVLLLKKAQLRKENPYTKRVAAYADVLKSN
jgi:hypothetical protein